MVARAWDGEAAERPVRLQIGRALARVLTFSGVLPGWLSRASLHDCSIHISQRAEITGVLGR